MKKKLILFLALPLLFAFAKPDRKSDVFVMKDQAVEHAGLYWSKCEVSNIEYKEFLMGTIEEGRADLIPEYAPNMEVWVEDTSFNDPYVKYYFSHPAFDNYPVVGVSYEAAVAFCEWKTRKFQGHVALNGSKPDESTYTFRLPTEAEWMAVARGEAKNDAWIAGGYAYPRDHKGRFLFNHRLGEGDYAGVLGGDPKDYEGYMITAPVRSFPRTSNGVYNIAGNVSEMVSERGVAKGGNWTTLAEECTIESKQSYGTSTSWLGFRYVLEKQ